jgi:hypothetical protein
MCVCFSLARWCIYLTLPLHFSLPRVRSHVFICHAVTMASSNLVSAYLFPKDAPPTRQAEELKKRAALSRTTSIGAFLKHSSGELKKQMDGSVLKTPTGSAASAVVIAADAAAAVTTGGAEVSQARFSMAVKVGARVRREKKEQNRRVLCRMYTRWTARVNIVKRTGSPLHSLCVLGGLFMWLSA